MQSPNMALPLPVRLDLEYSNFTFGMTSPVVPQIDHRAKKLVVTLLPPCNLRRAFIE